MAIRLNKSSSDYSKLGETHQDRTTITVKKYSLLQERSLSYRFYIHFHPYVGELIDRLLKRSVAGLQEADTEFNKDDSPPTGKAKDDAYALYEVFFDDYDPNRGLVPEKNPGSDKNLDPVKNLDFTPSGAYSVYNWELFYHIPLTVGIHLSKNQRFHDAQRWFHYIFDPTDDSEWITPERFWKVKPFQTTDVKLIEEILYNLARDDKNPELDPDLKQDTLESIKAWKENPFRPHVVARHRQVPYMLKAVMAYLDNLIAWGDSLFRQDTRESINEAMQLYVLAANILGPRPQAIPNKGSVGTKNYASIRGELKNNDFRNVLTEMEVDVPFLLAPTPSSAGKSDQSATLKSVPYLMFCIPRNDKLMGYWGTVADRLFKIRNSLNIQGVFRQLALFEPPIDPGMLAKAAAAGVDVGAVVSGANQPLPLVRFQFMVQKAAEICQEVKSLGNNLLSAIEKEDNEALSLLRAQHERVILGMAEAVKYAQWQEAIKAKEGLWTSLANTVQRFVYYERQLDEQQSDIDSRIPELEALDTENLKKQKFKAEEPEVTPRDIEVDIFKFPGAEVLTGGKKLSSHEFWELLHLEAAQLFQDAATVSDTLAAALAAIPDTTIQGAPWGIGISVEFGGQNLHDISSSFSSLSRGIAGRLSHEANKSAKLGGYARREQEWAFQSNLAAGEINQILKQLRAAQIREAMAKWEFKNHQEQIKNAKTIEQFLKGEETQVGNGKHKKTSTQSLYTWMRREVKGLYGQCFQFAFDIAKKAERALQNELGNPELSYLQYGYLAGKEGLLAGEKLYFDIKRMEMAYHDLNQREYELIEHVSLLQINPLGLLQLRTTGRCTLSLPEELFDMGGKGDYFRRIKSVAVSIPGVTGPYTSIHCKVTLLKSSIRISPQLGDGYARADGDNLDSRFSDHYGRIESIVTSTGQNDTGLFETNLRGERYLPFEGAGVVSTWQLQLPANPSEGEPQQFDYQTISDVVLHLRFTAREGGELLRRAATQNLISKIEAAEEEAGCVRLFSIRHEFPMEWGKFEAAEPDEDGWYKLALPIREEHYPFWSKGKVGALEQMEIVAKKKNGGVEVATSPDQEPVTLQKDRVLGNLLRGQLKGPEKPLPLPVSEESEPFQLYLKENEMEELWIALKWREDGQ